MIKIWRWILENFFFIGKCPECGKYELMRGYVGDVCNNCRYYKINK